MVLVSGSECWNANEITGKSNRILRPSRDAHSSYVSSDLRASLNGRDLPEEDKTRMLNMHEKMVRLEEEQRTTKEQLLKARAVCCLLIWSSLC